MSCPGVPAGSFNRSLLFDALTSACDQIDRDFAQDLRERDRKQHAFLTREVESHAKEIDNLRNENRRLKEQLLQFQQAKAAGELSRNNGESVLRAAGETKASEGPAANDHDNNGRDVTRPPLRELSANTTLHGQPTPLSALVEKEDRCTHGDACQARFTKLKSKHTELKGSYSHLVEKFTKLKARYAEWQAYAIALEEKSKKEKDTSAEWKAYAKTLKRNLEARQRQAEGPARSSKSACERPPSAEAHACLLEPIVPSGQAITKVIGRANPASSFSSDFGLPASRATGTGKVVPRRRAISTPPELATESHVHSSSEPSSTQDRDESILEQELPTLAVGFAASGGAAQIKGEPSSEGPLFVSERPVRKRKLHDYDPNPARASRRLKTEDDGSDPIVTAITGNSPQESVDLDDSRTELPTPRKNRLMPGLTGLEDALFETPTEGDSADSFLGKLGHSSPLAERTRVLEAIHTVRLDGERGPNPAQKAMEAQEQDGGGLVAPTENNSVDPFAPRRLAELLDAPSTPAELRLPRLTRRAQSPSKPPAVEPSSIPPLPPKRIFPFDQQTNLPSATTPKLRRPPTIATPVTSLNSVAVTPGTDASKMKRASGGRTLRDTPLANLRLDDFKPNPKVTGGFNFAFNDVVRGKGERESLTGCTDPNCPGGRDWKVIAESELSHAGPSLVDQASSVKLMEEFLGGDAYKIAKMNRLERQALWVRARTREQANKYGKCRHQFARPPTPGGFWDTGFPTTQEQNENNADGEKHERAVIEERYREAMRKGGKWLFRDEFT